MWLISSILNHNVNLYLSKEAKSTREFQRFKAKYVRKMFPEILQNLISWEVCQKTFNSLKK